MWEKYKEASGKNAVIIVILFVHFLRVQGLVEQRSIRCSSSTFLGFA